MTNTDQESDTDRVMLHERRRWLGLAIALALWPYMVAAPTVVRNSPLVAQDDARHYVIWMRRLLDPDLYRGDFIAEQLSSRVPVVYAALYRPFIALGFDPLAVQLWVFMPLSGIALTVLTYLFVRRFWPSSFGAAVAALTFLTIVGAPRGIPSDFGLSVALGLLLVFLSGKYLWGPLAGFAGAGILPIAAATAGASMSGQMLSRKPPYFTRDRATWLSLLLMGVGVVAAGLLAWTAARTMGEPFTAAEARELPFYNAGGRRPFFGPTFASTYLCNERAGIVPQCDSGSYLTVVVALLRTIVVLVLAIWLVASGRGNQWLKHLSLPPVKPQLASVWASLVVVGTALFVFSHLVAFQLENPQRFSKYGVGLSFVTMVAMTVAVCVTVAMRHAVGPGPWRWPGRLIVVAVLLIFLAAGADRAGKFSVVSTRAARVYEFLRGTPKSTLVAGIVDEIDNVSAFGWRPVFASMELLTAHNKAYYREMSHRYEQLAKSLYAADAGAFATLKRHYAIDYVLVGRYRETDLSSLRVLARNFVSIQGVVGSMERGQIPFYEALLDRCTRVQDEHVVLLDAACLVNAS